MRLSHDRCARPILSNGDTGSPPTRSSTGFYRQRTPEDEIIESLAFIAIEVFQTLKRRGHPDASLPTVSAGWGGLTTRWWKSMGSFRSTKG